MSSQFIISIKATKMVKCRFPDCDATLSSVKIRNIHEGLEHPVWSCKFPQCSSKTRSHTTYQKHLKSNHTNTELLKCNICDKVFKSMMTLKPHQDAHKSIKSYNCDSCPLTFSGARNLREHKKRKQNKGVFPCSKCDLRCSSTGDLNRHVSIVHGPSQNLPCKVCGYIFKNKKGLKQHMVRHQTQGLKVTAASENWSKVTTVTYTTNGEYVDIVSWHPNI